MTIIHNLFLYTGITGSTTYPEFQLGINVLYTILSLCALIIPFCFSNFYFTDNRYILCGYISIVYSVYLSCVKYFKMKLDKFSFSTFEQECTESQTRMLHINVFLFLLSGVYCLLGIPISLYLTGVNTLQLCLSILIGCFWFCFYAVCCSFHTYLIMFCYGQTTVIKKWLKGLKRGTFPTEWDSILQMYSHYYKTSKLFQQLWNNVLLITFCSLSFRIPFGFILIVYANVYWEIPLFLFYLYAILQLSVSVCTLNAQNEYFQTYFIKHPHIIQDKEKVEMLLEYNKIRTLGIRVYGFQPLFKHLLGVGLLIVNVAIPIGLSFLISSLK